MSDLLSTRKPRPLARIDSGAFRQRCYKAIRLVELNRPHVVLMDVRMSILDGVKATKYIHEKYPETRIMILTTFDDDEYVHNALNNGAGGYVLKTIKPPELAAAVRAVYNGTFLVSPSVGMKLVRQAHEGVEQRSNAEIDYRGKVNFLLSSFHSLSHREAEVLHLVLHDHSNREIAEKLCIAEQTVKNHISVIYTKLGVTDRFHAIKLVKKTAGNAVPDA